MSVTFFVFPLSRVNRPAECNLASLGQKFFNNLCKIAKGYHLVEIRLLFAVLREAAVDSNIEFHNLTCFVAVYNIDNFGIAGKITDQKYLIHLSCSPYKSFLYPD